MHNNNGKKTRDRKITATKLETPRQMESHRNRRQRSEKGLVERERGTERDREEKKHFESHKKTPDDAQIK